ncbi:hypothetical protein F2Q68_00003166 [Brassica cretica]|uniref:Uncharacterized protein n=1 Tax=Brassica cretica TaxID=69181 RepID=A0A8S9JEW6_BRACR|nr:hypothetical protein F2Q68_00003166 [Brassica cretica]
MKFLNILGFLQFTTTDFNLKTRPAPIEVQYHNLHREIKPARDVVFPRPAPVVEPLPAPTPSPSPPPPSLPPTVLEDRILEIAESMTTPLEPEAGPGDG